MDRRMAIDAREDVDQVERHGQAVKRVRSVCDMHRVPFGAVENLDELIASVRENRHFAMDFWALVGDLSARERGSLSDEETLDVIVESATGAGTESVSPGQQAKVEELKQLLAGVDVSRPAELPDPIAEPDDALLSGHRGGPRTSPNGTPRQGAPVVVLPDRNGTVKAGARIRVNGNQDAWVARRTIGEALSRLERTSTELREQLAAIDDQLEQQGSKPAVEAGENHHSAAPELLHTTGMEQEAPAHEDLNVPQFTRQPQVPSTPQHADWRRKPASVAAVERHREAKIETARQILREWNETHREPEVFAPRPAHTLSQRGLARPADDDDPRIPVPLSGYVENERRAGRRIGITAALLALLTGGGFLFSRTEAGQATLARIQPTFEEQYQGITERLAVLKREATPRQDDASSTQEAPPPGNAKAPAPQAPVSGNSTPANQSINPASQSESNVSQAAIAGGSQPQPSATTQAAPPTDTRNRRDRESARTRSSDIPVEPTGEGLVDDAATVKVPPSIMEANLVASRVPAYPEYAKAEGIEGPVVMEAIISKYGNVDHVRVIEGERHLRSAAEDAVLKWRYRPYVVNGRPVDVTTVVRVDFRLNGATHY